MSGSWRWLPWVGLVLVAAAVLVVGTQRSSRPSLQEETTHIAGLVRCPVCEGQSAAESQAPASVQIRDQIRQELSAGESQAQILAGLVAAYGPGILEKPEARGVGLLLWVLPVVAVVAAMGGLALAFARWRPRRAGGVTPADLELVERALGRQSGGGRAGGQLGAGGAGRVGDVGDVGGVGDGQGGRVGGVAGVGHDGRVSGGAGAGPSGSSESGESGEGSERAGPREGREGGQGSGGSGGG